MDLARRHGLYKRVQVLLRRERLWIIGVAEIVGSRLFLRQSAVFRIGKRQALAVFKTDHRRVFVIFQGLRARRIRCDVFAVDMPKRKKREAFAGFSFVLRMNVPAHAGVSHRRKPGIFRHVRRLFLRLAKRRIVVGAVSEPPAEGRDLNEEEGKLRISKILAPFLDQRVLKLRVDLGMKLVAAALIPQEAADRIRHQLPKHRLVQAAGTPGMQRPGHHRERRLLRHIRLHFLRVLLLLLRESGDHDGHPRVGVFRVRDHIHRGFLIGRHLPLKVRDLFQFLFVLFEPDFSAGSPDGLLGKPADGLRAAPVAADDANRYLKLLRDLPLEEVADGREKRQVFLAEAAPFSKAGKVHHFLHAGEADFRVVEKADRAPLLRRQILKSFALFRELGIRIHQKLHVGLSACKPQLADRYIEDRQIVRPVRENEPKIESRAQRRKHKIKGARSIGRSLSLRRCFSPRVIQPGPDIRPGRRLSENVHGLFLLEHHMLTEYHGQFYHRYFSAKMIL